MNEQSEVKAYNNQNMKSIFDCWNEAIRRFVNIKGRTTRYEFWAFQTVSLLIFIAAAFVGYIFGSYKIVFEVYAAYFIAPAATVSVRRLHDIGLSGYYVVPAVVLVLWMMWQWEIAPENWIMPVFLNLGYLSYLYWLLAAEGNIGANVYGIKVVEPSIYNQDSKVFISFMAVFLLFLWVLFFINLL